MVSTEPWLKADFLLQTYAGSGSALSALSPICCMQVSQGYLQPNVGGESIPTAEGELSDLAGDEPLFKALYQWCAHGVARPSRAALSCKYLRLLCMGLLLWLRLV